MEDDPASKTAKTSNPQQLLIQYLIESIQKQQALHVLSDFSKNNTQQDIRFSPTSSCNEQLQSNAIDVQQRSPYSERRRKNNEAAKRSRETRRAKEDEMAIRATWLEQENVQLRLENAQLKQENLLLRCRRHTSLAS